MEFNLQEITLALSNTLDLVGANRSDHGKRVGYLATEMGRHLGWRDVMLRDLGIAATLHDFGLSSSRDFKNITGSMEPSQTHQHCEQGWLLMSSFYPYAHLAPLLLHHHTPWENFAQTNLPSETTALMSNLIFLADRIEVLSADCAEPSFLARTGQIREAISKQAGRLFAPNLVQAFLDLSRHAGFWLYLEPKYLEERIRLRLGKDDEVLDLPQIRQLAMLFGKIVDSKSPFTAEHSLGVGRLARFLGQLNHLPKRQVDLLEIAGYFHDIGKLRVPDDILDKPGALTDAERAVVYRHTFDTYQILNSVKGFWGISEWAAFHHETPIGSGYPFGVGDPILCLEAKIMAVVDIFQALAQERPYRVALPIEKILDILGDLAEKRQIDRSLVTIVAKHSAECLAIATQTGRPIQV